MIGLQGKNNGKSSLRFDKVNLNGRIMTLPRKFRNERMEKTL
jgi:hypothetical protein